MTHVQCLLAGGKSGKAIFEYVDSKRIVRADVRVDSHVKLASIDQEWV